jgi:hypothetical protein
MRRGAKTAADRESERALRPRGMSSAVHRRGDRVDSGTASSPCVEVREGCSSASAQLDSYQISSPTRPLCCPTAGLSTVSYDKASARRDGLHSTRQPGERTGVGAPFSGTSGRRCTPRQKADFVLLGRRPVFLIEIGGEKSVGRFLRVEWRDVRSARPTRFSTHSGSTKPCSARRACGTSARGRC